MNQATANNHVEAWKGVIDFGKTVISISSAVLTAFLGYYALNQISIWGSYLNFVSPVLLLLSIVMALFGFGRSIKAISSGSSQKSGIGLTNWSVFFLVCGILAVALINIGSNKSLDKILAEIDRMPPVAGFELKPEAVQRIVMDEQNYLITYDHGGVDVTVTYSGKEGRIVKLERQAAVPAGKTQ